jgi:hypothetical protein
LARLIGKNRSASHANVLPGSDALPVHSLNPQTRHREPPRRTTAHRPTIRDGRIREARPNIGHAHHGNQRPQRRTLAVVRVGRDLHNASRPRHSSVQVGRR